MYVLNQCIIGIYEFFFRCSLCKPVFFCFVMPWYERRCSWTLISSGSPPWQREQRHPSSLEAGHEIVSVTGRPLSWIRASVYIIKKWPQQDLCCDAQCQNPTALTRHWAIRTRLHVWVCSCCTLRFLRVPLVGCRILCWDRVVAL